MFRFYWYFINEQLVSLLRLALDFHYNSAGNPNANTVGIQWFPWYSLTLTCRHHWNYTCSFHSYQQHLLNLAVTSLTSQTQQPFYATTIATRSWHPVHSSYCVPSSTVQHYTNTHMVHTSVHTLCYRPHSHNMMQQHHINKKIHSEYLSGRVKRLSWHLAMTSLLHLFLFLFAFICMIF